MIYIGLIHLLFCRIIYVVGEYAEPSHVTACGNSYSLLSQKLTKQLMQNNLSENLKLVNASTIQECTESCCSWEKCNFAVQTNGSCFNVLCQSYVDCQTEDYAISDTTAGIETVQVREIDGGCSNFSKVCEVGVDNCYENEECVPIARRRKSGCCKCVESFTRIENGTCISIANVSNGTFSVATASTQVTTPSTSTTTRYIRHLAISISPTSIQLPEAVSFVTAVVVPDPEAGEEYSYKWSILSYPQDQQLGTVEGNNEKTLKLSHLSPGNYTFQITVTSPLSYGEVLANLTVVAPIRINQHPVAMIQPSSQTIQLPNSVAIFNGLSSTDDSKIVSFKWELEKGPISYQFQSKETDTLELKDLVAGNYTVKLTVIDSDGEANSTLATLEVLKETDYPPESNAGAPIIVVLPDNEVTLNGNKSTDDHGITAWEWTLLNEEDGNNEPVKAVDMQNTNTPYPHISHLVEGMYRFQLKVYDVAGQSSTSTVGVLVRKPSSSEPRVDAGNDVSIMLPTSWAMLDGSKSVDDDGVLQKWQWTQLQGPSESIIVEPGEPKVNVTSLTNGTYVFQLTAWDKSGISASDNVTVTVLPKENEKPKANAGGDQSVFLPLKWVVLNGSSSSDDQGIRSWLWTREPESLAAGIIVANSDRTSTLMLTNLVPGKYVFRLTVTDAQGLSDHDIVTLIVHKNPRDLDVLIISLKADPRTFTESELTTIREQLALLLHQQGSTGINVNIDDIVIEPKSGYERTVLQFYTSVKSNGTWRTLPGSEVAALLKKKLRSDLNLLTYPVLDVDTALCQNNCSGHGNCDQYSRRCICQSLWMEDPFKVLNGGDYNCDWSVVYVFVITGVILFLVSITSWYFVQSYRKGTFLCKKCIPKKRRKPHRYTAISPTAIKLTSKAVTPLLPSDFDSETESDVVFETKKNGHANGRINKPEESYA